jgi:hypothetical protein
MTGGEIEASSLRFVHSASSRGPFISASNGAVIVINGSEITSESAGYAVVNNDVMCMCFW